MDLIQERKVMRQNLTIALLAVCATLLAVQIVDSIQAAQVRKALGQTSGMAGGNYVVATGITQSGNDSLIYVLDTSTQRLAAYLQRQNQGFELRAVRNIEWDLKLETYPTRGSARPSPQDIQKAFEEEQKARPK